MNECIIKKDNISGNIPSDIVSEKGFYRSLHLLTSLDIQKRKWILLFTYLKT